jgi:hypothetical protein
MEEIVINTAYNCLTSGRHYVGVIMKTNTSGVSAFVYLACSPPVLDYLTNPFRNGSNYVGTIAGSSFSTATTDFNPPNPLSGSGFTIIPGVQSVWAGLF